MLDLGSLAVGMGLQKEMVNVRKEANADVFQATEEIDAGVLSNVAEAVEGVVASVENAASIFAEAFIPSESMVATTLDACTVEAPSVNLSLPTAAKK